MSKKFLKAMVVATTICLTLLGTKGIVWGMWEELDEKTWARLANMHHDAQIRAGYCHDARYKNLPPMNDYTMALNPIQKTTLKKEMDLCPMCLEFGKTIIDIRNLQTNTLKLEKTLSAIPQVTQELDIKMQAMNEKILILEDELTHHKLLAEKIQQWEQERCRKPEAKEQRTPATVNEQDNRNNLIAPVEENDSLFSTVKSLRQIKLQHEETIKSLNGEVEESTEIIKQMMKIVGIKIDDFSDCSGNIFAKKCLDRLKDEMGNI